MDSYTISNSPQYFLVSVFSNSARNWTLEHHRQGLCHVPSSQIPLIRADTNTPLSGISRHENRRVLCHLWTVLLFVCSYPTCSAGERTQGFAMEGKLSTTRSSSGPPVYASPFTLSSSQRVFGSESWWVHTVTLVHEALQLLSAPWISVAIFIHLTKKERYVYTT